MSSSYKCCQCSKTSGSVVGVRFSLGGILVRFIQWGEGFQVFKAYVRTGVIGWYRMDVGEKLSKRRDSCLICQDSSEIGITSGGRIK